MSAESEAHAWGTPAKEHEESHIAKLAVDAPRKEPADCVLADRVDERGHGVVVHYVLAVVLGVDDVRAREEIRGACEVLVRVGHRLVDGVGVVPRRGGAAADVAAGTVPGDGALCFAAREEVGQQHADADVDERHEQDLEHATGVGGLDDGGPPARDREVELRERDGKRAADNSEQRRGHDGEDVRVHVDADLEGDVAAEEAKVAGVVDGAVEAVQQVLHVQHGLEPACRQAAGMHVRTGHGQRQRPAGDLAARVRSGVRDRVLARRGHASMHATAATLPLLLQGCRGRALAAPPTMTGIVVQILQKQRRGCCGVLLPCSAESYTAAWRHRAHLPGVGRCDIPPPAHRARWWGGRADSAHLGEHGDDTAEEDLPAEVGVPEARNLLKRKQQATQGSVKGGCDARRHPGGDKVALVLAVAEVAEDAEIEAQRRGVQTADCGPKESSHVDDGALRPDRQAGCDRQRA